MARGRRRAPSNAQAPGAHSGGWNERRARFPVLRSRPPSCLFPFAFCLDSSWVLWLSLFNLTAAGCGASVRADRELVVISPHRDEIRIEFAQAFARWYEAQAGETVHVTWLDVGGTSAMQRYLLSQFAEAGNPGIDLIFGGGTDPYLRFQQADPPVLEPYRVPEAILSRIEPTLLGVPLYDPDGYWYGTALTSFGILYNREVLRRQDLPAPIDWRSMADSRYFTWVGAGDPRMSGSVHMLYEIMLQAYGWDEGLRLITQIGGNARSFALESSLVTRDVNSGDVALAGAIDFFAFSLIAREGDEKIGFVLPEGQSVLSVDSIGILRDAPHRELARAFVRFVVSDEGQRLWIVRAGLPGGPEQYDLCRPPLIRALYELPPKQSTVRVNPFAARAALEYDSDKAGRRWSALNDLIGATLIDGHPELRRAWEAVILAGEPPRLVARLCAPPCDEQAFLELAPSLRNPRVRSRQLRDWGNWARAKYDAVARQALQTVQR